MSAATHPTYQPSEWQSHNVFATMLQSICDEQNITCTWLSDNWVAKLERGGQTAHIYGYTFPLNNAAAANIMRDKTATYLTLQAAGIAAIPHYLLRLRAGTDTQTALTQALHAAPLPVVVKPNAGENGGYDVVKCADQTELADTLADLSTRHNALAISPFTRIGAEYRVVLLDGQPKVVFKKQPAPGAWLHNLKKGATPQLITDEDLSQKLIQFAQKALAAVGGRLAAVDVVQTPAGLQIMEINGGITLNVFSQHNKKHAAIARGMYADIIAACLQKSAPKK